MRIFSALVFLGAVAWTITTLLMPPVSWLAVGILIGWTLHGHRSPTDTEART